MQVVTTVDSPTAIPGCTWAICAASQPTLFCPHRKIADTGTDFYLCHQPFTTVREGVWIQRLTDRSGGGEMDGIAFPPWLTPDRLRRSWANPGCFASVGLGNVTWQTTIQRALTYGPPKPHSVMLIAAGGRSILKSLCMRGPNRLIVYGPAATSRAAPSASFRRVKMGLR